MKIQNVQNVVIGLGIGMIAMIKDIENNWLLPAYKWLQIGQTTGLSDQGHEMDLLRFDGMDIRMVLRLRMLMVRLSIEWTVA